MQPLELLSPVWAYFTEHPNELVRIARAAAARKVGVPLGLVRAFAERRVGGRLPRDLEIEAVPPGIRVRGTLELMGAQLRASAIVFVEDVRLEAEHATLTLRFSEVGLTLLNQSSSPLAALIQSGALDLTKLGNLIAVMPRRPAFITEARGDRVTLDLKRLPALSGELARRLFELVTPVVTVTGIATDSEHLDIELGVFQRGFGAALTAWRSNIEQLASRWDPRTSNGARMPRP
jgi:hypothetical protein